MERMTARVWRFSPLDGPDHETMGMIFQLNIEERGGFSWLNGDELNCASNSRREPKTELGDDMARKHLADARRRMR